ncbi:MAG: ribonuclease III [Verrucomicrobia bacterium GWC2_42_7]|nr:MAG: ribonuclease III [Verrucomicrobia bacterium GWC2_42_7]
MLKEKLEDYIGYNFKDTSLLELAITHPSFAREQATPDLNYQRLEFLGDAVLSCIISESLYNLFPHYREGAMARARSALTKGKFLTQLSKSLHVMDFIRVSEVEKKAGGNTRNAALEDALESIIGAIFLDSGFEQTRSVVLNWYGDIDTHLNELLINENPKGILQEKYPHGSIKYELISESGPPHSRIFCVRLLVNNSIVGIGVGPTKKEAEEVAAQQALLMEPQQTRPNG